MAHYARRGSRGRKALRTESLNQPSNTLFFAAGIEDQTHGLYGRLDAVGR